MINSFYMLSDEDKKDVIDHIDEYSLEDIEAKLSVICVRNRVSFAATNEDITKTAPTTFNLNSAAQTVETDMPAWLKAVDRNRK